MTMLISCCPLNCIGCNCGCLDALHHIQAPYPGMVIWFHSFTDMCALCTFYLHYFYSSITHIYLGYWFMPSGMLFFIILPACIIFSTIWHHLHIIISLNSCLCDYIWYIYMNVYLNLICWDILMLNNIIYLIICFNNLKFINSIIQLSFECYAIKLFHIYSFINIIFYQKIRLQSIAK